jgi:hypothetical protein
VLLSPMVVVAVGLGWPVQTLLTVGRGDGPRVGAVGEAVGSTVGCVGCRDGSRVGDVGSSVGSVVGTVVGYLRGQW